MSGFADFKMFITSGVQEFTPSLVGVKEQLWKVMAKHGCVPIKFLNQNDSDRAVLCALIIEEGWLFREPLIWLDLGHGFQV